MNHYPTSFSVGVDRVLRSLNPHGDPVGQRAFPAGVNRRELYQTGDETLLQMFRRVVNATNGGDPAPFQVEENLVVFGTVEWQRDNSIRFCRLVALKTETCDIPYFFRAGENQREIAYFRLDVDARIGYLFTHPYPHVHGQPHVGPRYALNGWTSANAVVDFLEHVYIELFHDEWRQWARRVWISHWPVFHQGVMGDRFDQMLRAAQESNYGALAQFATEMQQLKGLLRVDKDDLFPLRLQSDRRDLLAYPVV